jgi:TonB family protein
VKRFDQRQGFLVSAVIHLALLMVLIAHPPAPRRPERIDVSTLERKDLVFLPPAAVLRQLVPVPPRPTATVAPLVRPLATPPPAGKKDRISIGPPTDLRTKGPIILRREDDLTKLPKGQPSPPPPLPAPAGPAESPLLTEKRGGAPETSGREGLRLPPGIGGAVARGDEGSRRKPGSIGDSIPGAVEGVTRKMQRDAQLGLPTGTGHNMGGLMFDPQGADFTLWTNRFKDEVYRNWIVPQSVVWGAAHGHVDFEFTVERNGTISSLRMLKSSGTASLDRAAQNALTGSRLLPLPDDYGPPRVTMQVTFVYNEAPQRS